MVYIGTPTYDNRIDTHTISSSFGVVQKHKAIWRPMPGSLLPFNCNRLWAEALNMRKEANLRYFMMIHADIRPVGADWFERMVEIKEKNDLSLLSVVSPLKDDSKDTSFAYVSDGKPHKLTLKAIENLPSVCTPDDIKKAYNLKDCTMLLNTGLMLCDLNADWCEKAYFDELNMISRVGNRFEAQVQSEDWFFTELVQRLGGKVGMTNEIELEHIGNHSYSNKSVSSFHKLWKKASQIPGWYSEKEGRLLYQTVLKSLQKQGEFVEVGSYCGKSSYIIAGLLKERKLTCIDPWYSPEEYQKVVVNRKLNLEPDPRKIFVREVASRFNVKVIQGFDIDQNIGKNMISFMHLDHNHNYEAVLKSLKHWHPQMEKNGLIAIHDYFSEQDPGVKKACDEYGIEIIDSADSLAIGKFPKLTSRSRSRERTDIRL